MNSIFKQFKYSFLYPSTTALSKWIGLRPVDERAGEGMVFIVTAGRSGSTLLAGLLNNHPQIHFPPEQSVLWFQINRFYGLPFESWKSYVDFVLNRFSQIHKNWGFTPDDIDKLESSLMDLEKPDRNIQNLMRTLYAHHASKYGKQGVRFLGDMTPITAILHRTVYPEFPKAKYIFLVRNPIDMVASNIRNPELGYGTIEKAAWRWKNSVTAYKAIRQKSFDVIKVRYEDLVSDTTQELTRILSWLDNDFALTNKANAPINLEAIGACGKPFHSNLTQPVNASQVGKGTGELSDDQLIELRKKLEASALAIGYPLK